MIDFEYHRATSLDDAIRSARACARAGRCSMRHSPLSGSRCRSSIARADISLSIRRPLGVSVGQSCASLIKPCFSR